MPKPLVTLLGVSLAVTIWSAVGPWSYDVWLFEIFAGLVGISLLAATYRRFRFSTVVYVLAGIHFVILAIAAKYIYAEMPLFNWIRDSFGLERNYYDRVGHFMQGFVPAIVAREILLRITGLTRGHRRRPKSLLHCHEWAGFTIATSGVTLRKVVFVAAHRLAGTTIAFSTARTRRSCDPGTCSRASTPLFIGGLPAACACSPVRINNDE